MGLVGDIHIPFGDSRMMSALSRVHPGIGFNLGLSATRLEMNCGQTQGGRPHAEMIGGW